MLRKIRTLKTLKDMEEWDPQYPSGNISIQLRCNNIWYRFCICNELSTYENIERVNSSKFNTYFVCIESEYCALFTIYLHNENPLTFCMKKQSSDVYDYKVKDFADFCDLYNNTDDLLENINQFKYFENLTDIVDWTSNYIILHDNCIWTTEINTHNDINYIIKFYARNVMTNIKYLVTEMEIIDSSNGKNLKCFFSKKYNSVV